MIAQPKYHLDAVYDPQQAHPDDAHSILMRLIPRGSRVLEPGCASGYLSGYMEQALGCHVTGLERDPAAAAIAATRCRAVHTVDLDAPDGLEVARQGAPYDVLLAAAVLEHLRHPQEFLLRARGLLAPDGLVIVSLPNIAHWKIRLRLLFGRFDYEDYGIMDRTHLHFYTVKTGRALLEEAGYAITTLHIAGSGLQNALNAVARRQQRAAPPPLLCGWLAYELIYVARRRPAAPQPQS